MPVLDGKPIPVILASEWTRIPEAMYMVYKMNVGELDNCFVRALKAMFKDNDIEIVVSDAAQSEEDETAYLLKSPANRERLLKAIENVAHDRNLVTINIDDLQ
jgi:antitoxin YefM